MPLKLCPRRLRYVLSACARGARVSRGMLRRSASVTILLGAATALSVMPAFAEAACDGTYEHLDTIELAHLLPASGKRSGFSNVWGREHVSVLSEEAPAGGTVIRVRFPQGSVNPGHPLLPSGGAGFLYRL
jgi:hypothetical protein